MFDEPFLVCLVKQYNVNQTWLQNTHSIMLCALDMFYKTTTADDARLAIEHNVDGIVVSNHGARQLDGVLATVNTINIMRLH